MASSNPNRAFEDSLNESLDAGPLDGDDANHTRKRRQRRIAEYEVESLNREDPLSAIIGASNAELQQMSDYISEAVLTAMNDQPPTIERVLELKPHVKLVLQIRHVIERDREVLTVEAAANVASGRKTLRPAGSHLPCKPTSIPKRVLR